MCQGASLRDGGRAGKCISQRQEGLERGKELDVHVVGVDGPGYPLTSLVLLNSCQSRSHPVWGLSHWEALPGHLHDHQPQPGRGDAVRVASRPPVSLLPPGELRQFCLSHYPNTARHLLGSTGDFPRTGATFQCPEQMLTLPDREFCSGRALHPTKKAPCYGRWCPRCQSCPCG